MSELISRKQAIEMVNNLHGGCITESVKDFIVYTLLATPSAPQKDKGKWKRVQIGEWLGVECTACHVTRDIRDVPCKNGGDVAWKFCPECGADMRGEEDERSD